MTRDAIRDRNVPDRKDLERWLLSEETGEDDGADAAFAHLFSAVPKVEAGANFVERAVRAAWRLRAARRRARSFAWVGAAVIVAAGGAAAYVAAPSVGTLVLKTVAFAMGRVLPWLIAYTTVAMDWWWTVVRIGSHVAEAIATPARAIALVGVELIGILAFFALQRLAGAERLGDAQL